MALLEDPAVRTDQGLARSAAREEEQHNPDLHDDEHGHEHVFEWVEAARIGLAAVAAAAVWFRLWEPFASLSVIGILGVIVGGWPIFKEAAENILARRMT